MAWWWRAFQTSPRRLWKPRRIDRGRSGLKAGNSSPLKSNSLTCHLLIRQPKDNLAGAPNPQRRKNHMAGDRPASDADRPAHYAGAIDCDLHPAVPGMSVLLPYLDDYWR